MFAKYGTSARLQIDYTYMNFHVVANYALREIFFPTLNPKYDKVITSSLCEICVPWISRWYIWY